MPASAPPPPPTGGNGKYIAALVLLAGGIAALLAFKQCGDKPATVTQIVSAKPAPTPTETNEEVPLPPELPDAAADTGAPKNTGGAQGDPCAAAKVCSGKTTDEMESLLSGRARAARKCYDQLLAQDNTLQGKVRVKVRVAANGLVCSAVAVSNETGSPAAERCATNPFRGIQLSAPKGGCVDVEIPLNFVPGGR